MDDQWHWWRRALEGERGETTRGEPKSGFYRDRNRACAIWRGEDGKLLASVTSGFCPKADDEIDEAFGFWSRSPVSHEDYRAFAETGRWPDEIAPVAPPGIGHNQPPADPHESIMAEINEHVENARAWLKEIGGKIVTQAHADKGGNYAVVFADLEKKADAARAAEKRPLDEAAKAVQAKWKPVVEAADEKKRWMKKATEDFLKAERARLDEIERKRREEAAAAQRAAAEAAREAEAQGKPAPAAYVQDVPAPVVKARAGTKGTLALRTRKVNEITGVAEFSAYVAALDPPPAEFMEALQRVANRICAAGVKPPGVVTRIEEYAA
jgi:hypothetical protein